MCRVARPHTTWQNAVIPEDMAKQIFTAEVNETYLEYLAELNRKMDFVKAARSAAVVPLAVQEVEPMLNKLRVKAVAKVREYLLQRIHSLKKPRTNLQMLQHNSLSKFRLLNRFLQSHAPAVFEEVQALYIETLSKLYGSYFQVCGFFVDVSFLCAPLLMCRRRQAYMTALLKLESQTATKYDLLATEPDKLKVRCCARVCLCRCASLTHACAHHHSHGRTSSAARARAICSLLAHATRSFSSWSRTPSCHTKVSAAPSPHICARV